jgi:hypothetical protein
MGEEQAWEQLGSPKPTRHARSPHRASAGEQAVGGLCPAALLCFTAGLIAGTMLGGCYHS